MPETEPSVADLFRLDGQVALVTGASGYLGSRLARALAEVGATVVATSRDVARAQAVCSTLTTSSGQTHFGVALDYTNPQTIPTVFGDIVSRTQKLDILVNNGHRAIADDWTTVTPEQFTAQLAMASGYFVLAREFRDHIVQRDAEGSLIMLGSMYGLVGSYPDAYSGICAASPVAYHTLKGGIIHMTRHLAVYWAHDRVRVNCLCPGPFPDPQRAPASLIARLTRHVPLQRMGQPHELKGAVVFLASRASSYMTGQVLVIDGGWTAW